MSFLKSKGGRIAIGALIALSWTAAARGDGLKHPVGAKDAYVPPSSPQVRAKLEWLKDQKLCLMMHFGLYSVLGITESWPLSTEDARWARADIGWAKDDADLKRKYYATSRCFCPVKFDATEWAKTAKRCGFRYIAFTTKHHDGFCLWDTKETDYKTTSPDCPYSTSPNADIVRKLFDACRAEGLGISAYFSKPDFHHDDFWENAGVGRSTTRYTTYDTKAHPEKWARFRRFTRNQMLELVRDYGPIDALWLDGGWLQPNSDWDLGVGDIIDEARKIQPDLLSVDRGAMSAYMDVRTPEQCVPEEPLPYPWESCITMSDSWGYHYDDTYKGARELIALIIDVVAKGGNLALNVGPAPDGTFPRPALERMETIGAWLAKNGAAIYATRPVRPYAFENWRFTQGKDGRVFAIREWKAGLGRVRSTGFGWKIEDCSFGSLKRITHLATGRDMPFSFVREDWAMNYKVDFPDDFVRDEYADAFVLEFKDNHSNKQGDTK